MDERIAGRAKICPGHTGRGERLMLEVELRRIGPDRMTVDHEPCPAGELELSICGELYPRGWRPGRDICAGGQIRDDLREVIATPRGPGKSGLRMSRAHMTRLADIWDRWHLNAMVAGCAHQPDGWVCFGDPEHPHTAPHGARPVLNGWAEIGRRFGEHPYPHRGDSCHECGRNRWDEPSDWCHKAEPAYRFGTSWLVDPLPAGVLADVRRICGIRELVGAE